MSHMKYHRKQRFVLGIFATLLLVSVASAQPGQVGNRQSDPIERTEPDQYHARVSIGTDPFRIVFAQSQTSEADTITEEIIKTEMELQSEVQDIQKELEAAQQQIQMIYMDSIQHMDINMEEIRQRLQEAMTELEALRQSGMYDQLQEIRTQISIPEISSRPFVGLIVENMDFRRAYELHYEQNYGVLVTGVIPNSPADQAGVASGDIIMEFDGQRVRYPDMLRNLIATKNVGDEVTLQVFRNETQMSLNLTINNRMISLPETPERPRIEDQMPSTSEQVSPEEVEDDSEDWADVNWDDEEWEDMNWDSDEFFSDDFFSAGYGGGGWLPIYFMMDMDDINTVVEGIGFNALPESGIFVNGGGGKGPVGNGWFIGGMGGGYGIDRKINYTINPGTEDENVIRRMKFSIGFGGVTMDKRHPISDKFVLGTGFMLGGGGTTLEINQTTGDYTWDQLPDNFTDARNSYLKLNKSYLMFQPRGTAILRITDWFSIRSEVGYLIGYSFKQGWEADVSGETFEVLNAPESNFMGGFTISVGPWFGF